MVSIITIVVFVVGFQLSQVGVFSIAQFLLVMVFIAFVVVFVARSQCSQVGIHFHCTTPTCYGFYFRVSIFTSWGLFPLHNSYLWFLLQLLWFML